MTVPVDRSRGAIFIVCLAMAVITVLEVTKLNVALIAIETALSASATHLQVLVAGYALAYGLALVPAGRLGDIVSRRRMFLIGVALFTLSSAACAAAPEIVVLMIGRIMQGIAAGVLMPQVLGYVQVLFSGESRGRAFGVYGAAVGVAAAIGPTVAGVIVAVTAESGWRALFWMNIPIGTAGFLLAYRLLPPSASVPRRRADLDLIGVTLLGAVFLAVMLPFTFPTEGVFSTSGRWLCPAVAVLLLVVFIWWERAYRRRGRPPAVDFELFRFPSFRNGLILTTLYFGAAPAFVLLVVQHLQRGLAYGSAQAGLATITFALGSSLAAWLSGRWASRWAEPFVAVGFLLLLLGTGSWLAVMVLSPPEPLIVLTLLTLLVGGLGAGLATAPNQVAMLADVPAAQAGVAGSLMQVGQRAGTAIGISVALAAYAGHGTVRAEGTFGLIAGTVVCGLFLASGAVVAVADVVRVRRLPL